MFESISVITKNKGYIAGEGDGILTVAGQAAQRDIILMTANSLNIIEQTISLKNGHYIITGLDLNQRYLLMARDYKKEFEPFVWDWVQPADDLTAEEQQALWQSWQTN